MTIVGWIGFIWAAGCAVILTLEARPSWEPHEWASCLLWPIFAVAAGVMWLALGCFWLWARAADRWGL